MQYLKNGSIVLWKLLVSALFKNSFSMVMVFALSACHSSTEGDTGTHAGANNAAVNNTASTLMTLLAGDNVSESLLESDEALRIAQSYPVPELPTSYTPFQVQTDTRFDQWTLSSMIRQSNTEDSDAQEWVWTKQEFFRVGLTDAEAEPSLSKWGFTDIVGQRFTQYHFGSQEHVTDVTAERVALNLASVSTDSITLNGVSLKINNAGCESVFSVQRNDEDLTWHLTECPNRVKVNDVVVGNTAHVQPSGISWVSQAYGQLPTGSGAVLIDRLDVLMPDGEQLNVTRSRRKSGAGPITVTATLKGSTLDDVTWSDAPMEGSVYPQEIVLDIPSLSQSFVVLIPDAMNQETSFANAGVQHGVTVTGEADNKLVMPGVLTMNPLSRQGL